MRPMIATVTLVTVLAGLPAYAAAQAAAASDPRDVNLNAYVDLLRADVRSQKVALLTEMMELTDEQDAAFWPVYREYDAELATLGDERISMIKEFSDRFGALTGAQAEALAQKAIDIDQRRSRLLAKCYERVKAATSPIVALRFLQVEHQMLLIIDLQISAMLPVAR